MWNVSPHPTQGSERRSDDRRLTDSRGYTGPERRATRERRVRTPGLLTPGLESGWLCFETLSEKRRLTPIPPGWDAAPERELETFFLSARPVTRRSPDE
ncbi:MAG TPA: hypothetical protein VE913_18060 [Longimicrobium sp.]|nr:hypothetical protein [Longimicrobium sp.]